MQPNDTKESFTVSPDQTLTEQVYIWKPCVRLKGTLLLLQIFVVGKSISPFICCNCLKDWHADFASLE